MSHIPKVFQPLIERILQSSGSTIVPDQLTINEYLPGDGIASHVDTHSAFDDLIVSISLGSGCSFDFIPRPPSNNSKTQTGLEEEEEEEDESGCSGSERGQTRDLDAIAVYFPNRAAVFMSGESRYGWRHGIAKRKHDRVVLCDSDHHQASVLRRFDPLVKYPAVSCVVKQLENLSNSLHSIFYPPTENKSRSRRVSLTFRKIRSSKACGCQWPQFCDFQQNTSQLLQPSSSSSSSSSHQAATVESKSQKKGWRSGSPSSSLCGGSSSVPVEDDLAQTLQQNDEETARKLENSHVLQFYEHIAPHFSNTRHSPWPRVSRFLQSKQQQSLACPPDPLLKDQLKSFGLEPGSLIADVGCGNGKYLRCIQSIVSSKRSLVVQKEIPTAAHFAIGCDISSNLVSICQKTGVGGHDLAVSDAMNLPYRSSSFDAVLSIAVFHHISTLHRRIIMARELIRIAAPTGRILVYAWAFEQEMGKVGTRRFEKQDVYVPWVLPKHFLPEFTPSLVSSFSSPSSNPIVLPEKSVVGEDSVVLQRYCHAFVQNELEHLFNEAAKLLPLIEIAIEESYIDRSNWVVLIRRLS